jgi:GT2 family glycosyltransferase
MQASVVVVDWKRPELTRRCLGSLTSQCSVGDVEIVLVVNEADAGEVGAYERDFPDVVVVALDTNTGFAGGVQAGVDAASGGVIVLLNNDAVAAPDFVARGLEALGSAGEGTAAVAARVELDGSFVPEPSGPHAEALTGLDGRSWVRSDLPTGVRLLNGEGIALDPWGNGFDRGWLEPVASSSGWPQPLFGFSGGACFVRREALDQVGGFDRSLFMYYEDLDVSWRLRLAGWEIGSAPRAVAVHRHAGSSSSGSPFIKYQSMRNRLAVVLRNGSLGMVLRVVVRVAGRAVADVVPSGRSQLSRAQWTRLLAGLPRLALRAVRLRRRDAASADARHRVERTFLAR